MRLRYQLVLAVLVITLMVSSFLAGRQFESVAAVAAEAGLEYERDGSGLVAALFGLNEGGKAEIDDISLQPLETFQEVLTHLRRQYVSQIEDERKMSYGAVRGMLAVLRDEPFEDRYSRFMEPPEYRSFLEENEGHFGGIGAEIGVREIDVEEVPELKGVRCPVCGSEISNPKRFQTVIIAPLPGSPAERAGIRAGDAILRIDDMPTAGITLGEVVQRIKGRPGTLVKLLVAHSGEAQPTEVQITRSVIQVRSVEWRLLPDRIGYLHISTFNDTTPDLVKEALADLRGQGMRALLLDLRNNAGGGLEVCVEVASQFIDDGPVVYIQERGEERRARNAHPGTGRVEVPLVALVNVGTASSAEILAGVIQDYELGSLVGVKTFGKGLVQTVFPLRDGSALALTTARYFTPKLRDIDHRGISPNVVVEQPSSKEYVAPLGESDAQGAEALRLLKKALAESPTAAT